MRIAQYSMEQMARNSSSRSKSVINSVQSVLVFEDIIQEEKNREDHIEQRKKMDLVETLMAILSDRQVPYQQSIPTVNPRNLEEQVMVTRTEIYYEEATMSFSSTGVVHTESGETIHFSCNIHFNKSYMSAMTTNTGPLMDPLVINFDNKGLDLSNKTIHIDLDLDGHPETVNMLKEGNGFLVLDKNNNGVIDDGSELFGPQTDNGFGELMIYDKDGNSWIDENDEIFNELRIWTLDKNGQEKLIPLKKAGIGAISTDHVDSYFDLKDEGKKGHIARTGVYLRENGLPGTIHEVKL